jgi:hypothetical protein
MHKRAEADSLHCSADKELLGDCPFSQSALLADQLFVMPSKQSGMAGYAAAGFLSTRKEAKRKAAVCFLADRLLGKILQHMGEPDISA